MNRFAQMSASILLSVMRHGLDTVLGDTGQHMAKPRRKLTGDELKNARAKKKRHRQTVKRNRNIRHSQGIA